VVHAATGTGRSSNGRTADSDSAYRGSNPCLPANLSRPRSFGWLVGPSSVTSRFISAQQIAPRLIANGSESLPPSHNVSASPRIGQHHRPQSDTAIRLSANPKQCRQTTPTASRRTAGYDSLRCHSPQGRRLGRTRSWRGSERVAWARSIARDARLNRESRSRSFLPPSRTIRKRWRGSSENPMRLRPYRIPTS
jgi:hypothetical protein